MHDNIVKSSIARQTNVSTTNNTETRAILSTGPTDGTLKLSIIKKPFTTMFIHVTFK